jgi:hypothetical protein
MSTLKLKFDSIVLEAAFVKADLKYHQGEFKIRQAIFFADLQEYLSTRELQPCEQKLEKNIIDVLKRSPAVQKPKLQNQSKKLFKEIASKTHPDRHGDPHKTKLFMEAKEAQENGDWFSLYNISKELDVEIPEPSKEQILWLKDEIKKLRAMVAKIVNTLQWIYCEDGAHKDHIMTSYCMATCIVKDE